MIVPQDYPCQVKGQAVFRNQQRDSKKKGNEQSKPQFSNVLFSLSPEESFFPLHSLKCTQKPPPLSPDPDIFKGKPRDIKDGSLLRVSIWTVSLCLKWIAL